MSSSIQKLLFCRYVLGEPRAASSDEGSQIRFKLQPFKVIAFTSLEESLWRIFVELFVGRLDQSPLNLSRQKVAQDVLRLLHETAEHSAFDLLVKGSC